MNYTVEDLLAKLNSGATKEELTDEFATKLTEAITQKTIADELKAKRAEEAKAQVISAKRDAAREIVIACANYCVAFCPEEEELLEDLRKMANSDEQVDALIEGLEGLLELFKLMKSLDVLTFPLNTPRVEKKQKCAASQPKVSADQIIGDFLSKMNL